MVTADDLKVGRVYPPLHKIKEGHCCLVSSIDQTKIEVLLIHPPRVFETQYRVKNHFYSISMEFITPNISRCRVVK